MLPPVCRPLVMPLYRSYYTLVDLAAWKGKAKQCRSHRIKILIKRFGKKLAFSAIPLQPINSPVSLDFWTTPKE